MSKEEEVIHVDMTPTWEQILPILLNVLENGKGESRSDMIDELIKMAKCADLYNEMIKGEEK
jgi:hypothetical protein